MTPKTPTASGISRLLAAAGFERSESSATRIKGWRNYSAGYSATGDGPGVVRVRHRFEDRRDQLDPEKYRVALQRYATVLALHGYATEIDGWDLIVTAKED
jgi:hypothetical protein